MAKSNSPIRLEKGLMDAAGQAAVLQKRSTAEQVEFWANIGRLVSRDLGPDTLLELVAGLSDVTVERKPSGSFDMKDVLGRMERLREEGTLARMIPNDAPNYQASIDYPGYLEEIGADGTVRVGTFSCGAFTELVPS